MRTMLELLVRLTPGQDGGASSQTQISGSVTAQPFVNPRARYGLSLRSCSVVAAASFLPAQVLTNAEVGRRMGEDGAWIFGRTGIQERRHAHENEFPSD